jgi:hypothetical protein
MHVYIEAHSAHAAADGDCETRSSGVWATSTKQSALETQNRGIRVT